MAHELHCHDCNEAVDVDCLIDNGIVECVHCGSKFVVEQHAMTHQDEMPLEEYLGG